MKWLNQNCKGSVVTRPRVVSEKLENIWSNVTSLPPTPSVAHYIYACMYLDTCAELTFLFLSEVYDLFQLLCVPGIIFCFYCFPPEAIFL